MDKRQVSWVTTPAARTQFLNLPNQIYPRNKRTRNRALEQSLLAGTHTLSPYFHLYPLLVYKDGLPAGRAALTIYPESEVAYLGFFECLEDEECAQLLFQETEKKAFALGCQTIVGPVDASFWIGYRMKANRFDDPPYFTEPYNPAYYCSLWENAGFTVSDRYQSTIYRQPEQGYTNAKCQRRFAELTAKGCEIRPLRPEEWKEAVREIGQLIMTLYSDFPVFTAISEADFLCQYEQLSSLLDFSMTRVAYDKGKMVGFLLGVPDYGTLLSRPLHPATLLRILWRKKHPKRYIMLYMGVLPQYRGLGNAFTHPLAETVRDRKAEAIGAFIHQGKATQNYATDRIQDKYEYLLFAKEKH